MLIDTEKLSYGVYAINPFIVGCPLIKIDPSQSWFWAEDWIKGELQVDKEISEGKVYTFDSMEDFLKDLKV